MKSHQWEITQKALELMDQSTSYNDLNRRVNDLRKNKEEVRKEIKSIIDLLNAPFKDFKPVKNSSLKYDTHLKKIYSDFQVEYKKLMPKLAGIYKDSSFKRILFHEVELTKVEEDKLIKWGKKFRNIKVPHKYKDYFFHIQKGRVKAKK